MMTGNAQGGSATSGLMNFGRRVVRHLRARLEPRPGPSILMYHRIADDEFNPWGTIISPRAFEDQLAWIARRRTPLPLSEFAELQRAGSLPRDAIALTFDDGYADNAEVAAPLLQKFGVPATIFLPVEWVERGEPYWWDELRRIVFEHDERSLTLGKRTFRLGDRRDDDGVWKHAAPPGTPRQVAFHRIWTELLPRNPDKREKAMAELRKQFVGAGPSGPLPRPMTRDQIRNLAAAGVEFGSHTLRHPNLTELSAAARKREILDSIPRCEALSGSRPTSFAYPFGIFDEQCEALVRKAGFDCACSTEAAAVGPASRSHALPRMHVGDWPARKLALRLALL